MEAQVSAAVSSSPRAPVTSPCVCITSHIKYKSIELVRLSGLQHIIQKCKINKYENIKILFGIFVFGKHRLSFQCKLRASMLFFFVRIEENKLV